MAAEPLETLAAGITMRAPASVVPANVSIVAAEVDGVVASMAFDVAQTAEVGDVLVRIDDTDLQLALELAQANLAAIEARIALAEGRAARARELNERNFASVDDVAARETDLAALRADRRAQQVVVRQAKRELDKATIIAPFTGSVIERQGQLGAYVSRGTALLILAEIGNATIRAQLEPLQAKNLQGSGKIEFESQGRRWPVTLTDLSQVIDERSRIVPARLTFDDSAAPTGTTGYLVWRGTDPRVPATYVVKRNGTLGVFVLNSDTARFVAISDAQEGRPASVPLSGGTKIITDGRHRVNDGDKVTVIQP